MNIYPRYRATTYRKVMAKRSRAKYPLHVKSTTIGNNLSVFSAASERRWITDKKSFAKLHRNGMEGGGIKRSTGDHVVAQTKDAVDFL